MEILLIDKVHQLFKQQFQLWGWEVVEGFHWDYNKLLLEIASFNGIIIRSRFVLDKTILSNAKKLNFIINEKDFIKKVITFDELKKAQHNLNIDNKEKYLDFSSIMKNDLSEKNKIQNLNLKRSSQIHTH